MSNTNYSNLLAAEIIKSWSRNRSNYIIVAPPMSNARALFATLSNCDFIRSIAEGKHARLSISRLDTSDFKDNLTFARKVLKGWGIYKPDFANEDDAVSLLNLGASELKRHDKRGVLLIHRFHEALEKLGEDIGTALRNLEHDYGLRTVVELPVSLTCLRERWDALDREKPPFLASDWGQGHTVKYLKGYTIDEIEKAVSDHLEAPALAKEIFRLTGGLNDLVISLLDPAITMKVKALAPYAYSRASSMCSRLIKWLDKPKDNTFKRLIAQSAKGPLSAIEMVKLGAHDWSAMLIVGDGSIGCAMIVHACNEIIVRSETIEQEDVTNLSNEIKSSFKIGDFDQTYKLLNFISINNDSNYSLKAAKLLCDLAVETDAYGDDWQPARKILSELENLENLSAPQSLLTIHESLDAWLALSNFMCDFSHHKKKDFNLRLEQFAVQSGNHTGIKCLLQLQLLRLQNASRLKPYLALKSVIEQPESLLQLYAYIKFNIIFWNYEGMLDIEAEAVSALIKKPFRPPLKNSRLGFIEMLYIVFWKEKVSPGAKNLLSSYSELLQIEAHYDKRKEQVHSTGVVSAEDWSTYAALCHSWLSILSNIDQPNVITPLPSCEQMFFSALDKCLMQ